MAQNSNKKTKWMFILFGTVFFGPVLAAVVVYFLRPSWLEQTTNKGELIIPPRDFYSVQLHAPNGQLIKTHVGERKWLLIYVTEKPCDTECKRAVYKMRQIYKAFFDSKQKRVERLLLTFQRSDDPEFYNWLNKNYEGTRFLIIKRDAFMTLTNGLPSQHEALNKGVFYVVDPNGNLMMSYSIDSKPKSMLSDLRKLLRNSQIG